MRESVVEKHLTDAVDDLGGQHRKLRWIGRPHAPDQFIALPAAGVWLVELKRPGKGAEEGQAREHIRLRAAGTNVHLASTLAEVDNFLRTIHTMDDATMWARLSRAETIFEKAVAAYVARLEAEKQELVRRVAQLEKGESK